MSILTTPLPTLLTTVIEDTVIIILGLIATLILPIVLFIHGHTLMEQTPRTASYFSPELFFSNLGRNDAVMVTFGIVVFTVPCGYLTMIYAVYQELQTTVVEATGRSVSLICGIEIGICVVYAGMFVLYRCFMWSFDGRKTVEAGSRAMKAD